MLGESMDSTTPDTAMRKLRRFYEEDQEFKRLLREEVTVIDIKLPTAPRHSPS